MSRKEPRKVTRKEFDAACAAVWSEIEYQNNLDRRTTDEAKDAPGFAAMSERVCRQVVDDWYDYPAFHQADTNTEQVPQSLNGFRKLAGCAIRAMIYCGIRARESRPAD